jgi:predicted transcriptional regulator
MRGDPGKVGRQFGRNLAEARGWVGMTQGRLARQASVDQAEIARLERGQRCPRLDAVVKLAGAVGVQVRDLLYGIE